MSDLRKTVDTIVNLRSSASPKRSLLVSVTGIDGCGKGHITARIADALRVHGLRVANINIDGWLNLPYKRFNMSNPAEHFYANAIRFDEMFSRLVFPLCERRSIRLEADFTEETAVSYRKHLYEFHDIDVVILEGIYLLKREFQSYYDLSVWIECSFDTALERAVMRAQEGLSPSATINAYKTIYFPAQEIHFLRDNPMTSATLVLNNDQRIPATADMLSLLSTA
jgi:uridine kinase